MPWDQFNALYPKQDDTGRPKCWTAKNSFDDATIQVYPEPDADAASSYTLEITYYERLGIPTADSDLINAPRELHDVLCAYAQYWVLFDREPKGRRWGFKREEYADKLHKFRRSRTKQPDEVFQWGLAIEQTNTEYDPLS